MAEINGSTEIPSEMASSAGEAEVKAEDIVTKEILDEIVKGCNRPDLELVDFDVKQGTIAGDNYMSIMYALKLNMRSKSTGETEIVPIMLKVLPQSELRRKIIKDGNIFVRDISFYQDLAPAMEKFQRDVGIKEEEIFRPWPKCYASKTDGENDYLAMEDLKKEGFSMASRQLGLDFEHCELVMTTLARFHALSFAMFKGDYDTILEKYPWSKETMFKEDSPEYMKDMFRQTFVNQEELLKKIGEEKAAANLETMLSFDFFTEMGKLLGSKVKWAVIGHGDSWTNNMMFQYDEETKQPININLLDFQICRASSRAVDIHYFLYSSPQMEVLNEKADALEEMYFEEFTKFAKKLQVDIEANELSRENLMKEIEKYRFYGCVSGLMMAMMMGADSTDVPDMEQIKEEDLNDLSKVMAEKFLKGTALEKIKNLADNHLPKCPQMQGV